MNIYCVNCKHLVFADNSIYCKYEDDREILNGNSENNSSENLEYFEVCDFES